MVIFQSRYSHLPFFIIQALPVQRWDAQVAFNNETFADHFQHTAASQLH